MKSFFSIITILLFTSKLISQESVQLNIDYSVDSKDLKSLMIFDRINLGKFMISGKISNLDYTVEIDEYKYGKLVNTDTLFDSSQNDYFKIKNDSLKLTMITQNTDEKVVIQMHGPRFNTEKLIYQTPSSNGRYTYKDFLGKKTTQEFDPSTSIPLFTIITPTVYDNGFKSYCDVANSAVAPNSLGKEFNIPHYFVASVKLQ